MIAAVNADRPAHAALSAATTISDAERTLEAMFDCRHRLAVYGTLAPGRANYHVVEPLGGTWSDGFVEGELSAQGWGAQFGYRAVVLRAGSAIPVQVLHTSMLDGAWARLDTFEGEEYRRLLVPVLSASADGVVLTVANIYAAS